jgi:hypothetical protein
MMLRGSCLCGQVHFKVNGALSSPTACHCTQCRKQSGHYFASANVNKSDLELTGAEHLSWYHASEKVRRGFCSKCGSWMFWEPIHRDWTSISLGVFDGATSVKLEQHIFVANKGDYYEITDGLSQKAQ